MIRKAISIYASAMVCALAAFAPADAQYGLKLPLPHAGASCHFAGYQSWPIGYPMPSHGGKDLPGPSGNETKQIYQIFYALGVSGRAQVVFAGWLYEGFDGRFAYGPAGIATAAHPLAAWSVDVTPPPGQQLDAASLPVGTWIRTLSARANVSPGEPLQRLIGTKPLTTALSRCFSTSWDGK